MELVSMQFSHSNTAAKSLVLKTLYENNKMRTITIIKTVSIFNYKALLNYN